MLAAMRRLLLLISSLILGGCAWITDPLLYKSPSNPLGMSPRDEQQLMTQIIEHNLSSETKGGHPTAGKKTWREFWRWRYSAWRKFPDGERWVSYTRLRRKQLGLPPI